MEKPEIHFLLFSLSLTLIGGCSIVNKESKEVVFSSREKAEQACDTWKDNGGIWQLKINDFRISDSDQEKKPLFPITLENKNNQPREEFSKSNNDEDMTVFLPLFSSVKRRDRNTGEIKISSIGDDKYINFARRLCSLDSKEKNMILGKEYLIDRDAKSLDSSIPPLNTRKSFLFD